jgi:uncharacterized membrane protein YeaQ/YmgE (transglycosylase-associated protein family)
MNIVAWLIVGCLVGWAASLVWHDLEGIVVNVVVGVTGALISGWTLAPTAAARTVYPGDFSLVGVGVSLLGAVTLLAVVNLVRLGSPR